MVASLRRSLVELPRTTNAVRSLPIPTSSFVSPERRGGAPLIHLEGAVLESAGPLIAVDDDACARHFGTHKLESPRHGTLAEESLAGTNHDCPTAETRRRDRVSATSESSCSSRPPGFRRRVAL